MTKLKHKTTEELEEIRDTRINGNISAYKEAVRGLDSYDTARLISISQPYHSAIAHIELAWEE